MCAGRRRSGTSAGPSPSNGRPAPARSSCRSPARCDHSRSSGSRSRSSTRSRCGQPRRLTPSPSPAGVQSQAPVLTASWRSAARRALVRQGQPAPGYRRPPAALRRRAVADRAAARVCAISILSPAGPLDHTRRITAASVAGSRPSADRAAQRGTAGRPAPRTGSAHRRCSRR